jgi:hypothetical protein
MNDKNCASASKWQEQVVTAFCEINSSSEDKGTPHDRATGELCSSSFCSSVDRKKKKDL